jgi:hypothetical protein
MIFHRSVLSLLIVLAACVARAQSDPQPIKARYTKFEHRIPMRDGTRLFTSVYVPKEPGVYPIMLSRTPYSVRPYGVDQYPERLGPSPAFSESGYIFAYQDVRGRWMSEGEFVNVRPCVPGVNGPGELDESTDTYDTVDWLVKNVPDNSGKVGMWGISYPGFYAACGLVDSHPALAAVSPQAPVTDWFGGDDWHHNGAFLLSHCFNFLANFGRPRSGPTTESNASFRHGTPDGYQFFLDLGPLPNADQRYFKGEVPYWNEVMGHGTNDAYWQARNLRKHLRDVRPAVMTVGGWFDAENLAGALETYEAIESTSPKATNVLVMGPWVHGGWSRSDGDALGDVPFNDKTAPWYRDEVEFPFFELHLKGKADQTVAEATVFETGTNRWRRLDRWPPAAARSRSLYLRSGGRLDWQPPASDEATPFDQYESDPARPVPVTDGIELGMPREYMTADQRHAARRPDVLVYSSPVLEHDLTVAGPVEVEFFVSTTGTDSDWVVKLIDVYPNNYPDPDPNPTEVRMGGYQQLVRGDVLRGKFRDSLESPQPFVPSQVTPIRFALSDVLHTFRPGHRIMIQVQSSWFPLFDRNPQTFCDIYRATEGDFQKAVQQVLHTADHPSHVRLGTLP